MRKTIVAVLLVLVFAGSAGLAAGLWVAPMPVPDVVMATASSLRVDVVPTQFDDARGVSVQPTLAAKRDYASQAIGTVVESRCKTGRKISSGNVVLLADDRPVVALRLARPPWRDLAQGVKGTDVADLQAALDKLGYAAGSDGVFSGRTALAVRKFWADRGVAKQADMPLGQLVWLPKKSATPSKCPKVGDVLTAGGVLFTSGGQLEGLKALVPESAFAGERVAVSESGLIAAIDPDGMIKDKKFLAEFAKSEGLKAWRSDNTKKLSVNTRLATELEVVPVPASALYEVRGKTGCVLAEGVPTQVEVIASELGKTMIQAPKLPSWVDAPAERGAASCW